MDYDSSSKFISSLAKFLQSLCNGYVEFDNGVEVIGHIYLSVDTGKKIDYILNEKVCKTDENSVTFISNSFHAQPAEKPKPNSKKGRNVEQSEPVESVEKDEGNSSVEPKSTNFGTVNRNPNRQSKSSSPGPRKRPFSPHSKGSSSTSKKGRNESSQDHLSFGIVSDEGNLSFSATNTSTDSLRGHPHQSSSNFPPPTNSQSYDPGYHPATHNSSVGNSEERDIKPSMDTDVTFVKEEFGSPQEEEEKSQVIDGSYSSMHSANQQYSEGPSSQSYGQQNSSLSFDEERSDNGIYDTSISQLEGNEAGADPSVANQMVLQLNTLDSHEDLAISLCRMGASAVKDEDIMDKRGRSKWADRAKRFQCQYCWKSFVVKRDCEGHVNSVHLKVKPFTCEFCNWSSAHRGELQKHVKKCQQLFQEVDPPDAPPAGTRVTLKLEQM